MAHQGHKLGDSNTQAVYYSAAAAIEAAVDPISHTFLKCADVPFRETADALKAKADTIIPAAARQAQNDSESEIVGNDNIQQVHRGVLSWLCKAAGPDALSTPRLAGRLVSIPNPAQLLVATLVIGGVRVPFEELAEAAKARVPGCEEWGTLVRVGNQGTSFQTAVVFAVLPPPKERFMHTVLMDVCDGSMVYSLELLHRLSPEQVVNLLHLALNTKNAAYGVPRVHTLHWPPVNNTTKQNSASPDLLRWILHSTAGAKDAAQLTQTWQQHTAAMEQLQKHVSQPYILRELLQTAVLRRHTEAAALLCHMSSVSELSVGYTTALIGSALSPSSDDWCNNMLECKSLQSKLLTTLCQNVPAAHKIPVSCVAQMVSTVTNAALSSYDHVRIYRPLLEIVCEQLPAALELPVSLVADLIYKVIKHPDNRSSSRWVQEKDIMLEILTELPAAQEIPQATAEEFLYLCLQQKVSFCIVREPMQQLGVASVRSLLLEACDWYRLTPALLNHPAMQHLSSDDEEQLLLAALAKQEETAVSILCQHVVAAKLSPAAVGRLLAAAVQLGSSIAALEDILTLLRTGTVTMDDYLPAIRTAVQKLDTAYLEAILDSMHAAMPYVAGRFAMPEALRTAVLIGDPERVKVVWQLCVEFDCGEHAAQEQATATVVCAILTGNPAAIQQVIDTVPAPPVKVWQQLLALAVLAKQPEAALMIACECSRHQQVNEPWLPEMRCLAVALGRTEHVGECHGMALLRQFPEEFLTCPKLLPILKQQSPTQDVLRQLQQLQQMLQISGQAMQPQQSTMTNQQQQSVHQWLQEPGLQQLLQLQGQEQQVFSEQCLQQVVGRMAAATRGTAATSFLVGWGSCWDARTGSPTIVLAAVLQLLHSKTDPHALQLFGSSIERMESMYFQNTWATTAAVWFAELLQVAVTASNADACRLICSRKACEHIPLQHLSNMLMLAAQQAQFSRNAAQRQQRMAVLQHVCSLFSGNAFLASRMPFGYSGPSTVPSSVSVCVRQVLAYSVQAGDEQVLQVLLGVDASCGCWQLLNAYDLYILVLTSLRSGTSCRPGIIKMLCGLCLREPDSWKGYGGLLGAQPAPAPAPAPAFTSMSVYKLYQLLRVALISHRITPGVSEIVRLLASWDPRPGGSVGRYTSYTGSAIGVLCDLAKQIVDARERAAALQVLYRLY